MDNEEIKQEIQEAAEIIKETADNIKEDMSQKKVVRTTKGKCVAMVIVVLLLMLAAYHAGYVKGKETDATSEVRIQSEPASATIEIMPVPAAELEVK